MNETERLAKLVASLESVGITCLVMGGHAVRHYGFARTTDDFDLHVAPAVWGRELVERLRQSGVFSPGEPVEGDTWRPAAFRRFRLGTLADGRIEWLEFWRHNHLLAPFGDLVARSEEGRVGGRPIRYLGLADLLRSKETERDKDWRDVSALEQVADARAMAAVSSGRLLTTDALSGLRSRAGFENWLRDGRLGERTAADALPRAALSITRAFLIPFAPAVECHETAPPTEPILLQRLRQTTPGSALHLSIVEVVRRRYVQHRKDEDRQNKQRSLADSA